MASEWIDVSVPLHSGMVHWPDNPPVQFELTMSMDHGDICNVSKLSLGAHTGTHMDAPAHFVRGGIGIDQMPLTVTLGRARVVAIDDSESIKAGELQAHDIRRGERILFKTRNSARDWRSDDFMEDFVYIAHDAAQHLAAVGVRAVGVDYLSVGGFRVDGPETHQALLEAGIWIIEGLNLSQAQPGLYDLICLPLRIVGGDGAPARAMLRAVDPNEPETL